MYAGQTLGPKAVPNDGKVHQISELFPDFVQAAKGHIVEVVTLINDPAKSANGGNIFVGREGNAPIQLGVGIYRDFWRVVEANALGVTTQNSNANQFIDLDSSACSLDCPCRTTMPGP